MGLHYITRRMGRGWSHLFAPLCPLLSLLLLPVAQVVGHNRTAKVILALQGQGKVCRADSEGTQVHTMGTTPKVRSKFRGELNDISDSHFAKPSIIRSDFMPHTYSTQELGGPQSRVSYRT